MKSLLTVLVFIASLSFLEARESDRLINNISKTKLDTSRIRLYEELIEILIKKEKNYSLAEKYINKSLGESASIGDDQGRARILDLKGVSFRNSSRFDSSLHYHFDALKIANEIDDKQLKLRVFNNIGVVYRRKDEFQTAIDYHLKALRIAEQLKDEKSIAIAENSIGNIYISIGKADRSLKHFLRALNLEEKSNNELGMAINYNNIGSVYEETGKLDMALEYYNKSLELNNKINNIKGISIGYNSLGSVFKKLKNYPEALKFYEKALEIDKRHSDEIYTSTSLVNIGEIYFLMGNNKKASEYVWEGINLAQKIGSKYQVQRGHEILCELYSEQGDYKMALSCYQTSISFRDSIINEKNNNQILDLQAKYDLSIKESQIELLKRDKKNQSIIIASFIFGVLSLVVILFMLWKSNNIKKRANDLLTEQSKQIESNNIELHSVNEQLKEINITKDKFFSIIAHDLKNPLTAIILMSEIAYKYYDKLTNEEKIDSIKKLHESARKLFQLLENLLTWARSQTGQIEFKLERIDLNQLFTNTIQLFNEVAIGKNVKITQTSQEVETISADMNMISTILRNLLSNAIKFTAPGGNIEIGATSIDSQNENRIVRIFVKDSGVGMTEETKNNLFRIDKNVTSLGTSGEKGTGLGLILCKEFIEKHGGRIWVESERSKGSTFWIEMPTNIE